MAPLWKVVGGASSGGIVVRVGQNIKSAEASKRLSTGALVEEVSLEGERLHFALLSGEGPESGWVSLHVKDKELLRRAADDEIPDLPGRGRTIWIISTGSRGDMQPFIALGGGLRRAGYRVLLIMPDLYESTIKALGLDFRPGGDWQKVIDTFSDVTKKNLTRQGIDIQELKVRMYEQCYAAMARSLRSELDKGKPDLLIWGGDASLFALAIWRKYQIPTMHATATLPDPKDWVEAGRLAGVVEANLGFAPLQGFSEESWKRAQMDWDTLLVGCSVSIFDAGILDSRIMRLPDNCPADCRDMLRKHREKVTGCWVCDKDLELASTGNFWGGSAVLGQLQDFLDKGEPPVYFGWGSMVPPVGPQVVFMATLGALMATGRRGIILEGWAMLSMDLLKSLMDHPRASENHRKMYEYAKQHVLFVKTAPHQWLFPRCGAVVHHGGAGTVTAAMRAAVPQIITPLYYDQFMYADMVTRMGLGFAVENWSTPKFKKALEECLAPAGQIRAKAAEVAEIVSKERGVEAATKVVQTFLEEEVESGRFMEKWRAAHGQ